MALQLKNYDPAVMAGASIDVNLDLGEIFDPAGNEMLEFDQVDSAVNFLRIANSVAGTAPGISAQGDDTNVDLTLTPKGTGAVSVKLNSASDSVAVIALDLTTAVGSQSAMAFTAFTGTTEVVFPGSSIATAQNTGWVRVNIGGTARYIPFYK